MLTTLVSVDDSPYLLWQTELLLWSHRRTGQPGSVVRLVATNETPRHLDGVFSYKTVPASPDPLTLDLYPPYNKPSSLAQYLRSIPYRDEIFLIVDPDCIFLRPIDTLPTKGSPIAESMFFMIPDRFPGNRVLYEHADKNIWDKIQPLGIPLIIHRDDLALFVDRWYELTREMRQNKITRSFIPWICEMWACAIAAAEVGVKFQLMNLQQFPTEAFYHRPLIHYSYDIVSDDNLYKWSKRSYIPWDLIPSPPSNTPETGKLTHSIISEFISTKNSG